MTWDGIERRAKPRPPSPPITFPPEVTSLSTDQPRTPIVHEPQGKSMTARIALFAVTFVTLLLVSIGGLLYVTARETQHIARTNEANIGDIITGVIYIRSCADEGHTTEASLTACVRYKLARP